MEESEVQRTTQRLSLNRSMLRGQSMLLGYIAIDVKKAHRDRNGNLASTGQGRAKPRSRSQDTILAPLTSAPIEARYRFTPVTSSSKMTCVFPVKWQKSESTWMEVQAPFLLSQELIPGPTCCIMGQSTCDNGSTELIISNSHSQGDRKNLGIAE